MFSASFWVSLFVIALIVTAFYKGRQWQSEDSHPKFRSYIPSLMTTLGTFVGIILGLWDFDTDNINQSIPVLLGGLKTAFITSIAGTIGSIGFKYISLKHQEEKEEEEDLVAEEDDLADEILAAARDQAKYLREMLDAVAGESDRSLAMQFSLMRNELKEVSREKALFLEDFRRELNTNLQKFIEKLSSAASDQMIEAL